MEAHPRRAAPEQVRECVLLKHGEVFLRGRNRARFEELLYRNLRDALRTLPGPAWVEKGRSVTLVGGEPPLDQLVDCVRRVIGFSLVQPAVRIPSTVEDIGAHAVRALRRAREERGGSGEITFAVRPKRRDKSFPLTSSELAVTVGERVRLETGARVNLSAPDVELAIEVDRNASYLSWSRLPGRGGLPVGSSGRALALLSGGYDSPVAAYRAMRRGMACDFVHFTGAPYTDASSVYKAYALARELNRFQPDRALWVVPLGKAQKQLAIAGAGRLQVVAQRRLMARTASALARRLGAEALVTGDSLGQVASQTVANMAAVDEAASVPLLRPLLGWEKQEIIDEARALGTADVSALPDEDCCSLLAPRQVSTRARVPDLERVERRLEVDELVDELLAGAWSLEPGAEAETDDTDASPEAGCRL
ncbi:tRNA uracil 4-sulfurtransferase ThiI [Streptomyces sp. 891-h]|uniref:tRNA uracil 4-sulfurtransferase ThiI n=1 Tax=Streptomyces sp. 891-h TaxID=2720714 RepID=UPI001FAA157F|nr:tRNA uracil 4-sulfurtransferase ThiI [Streptomyces sp. 891-h]UNZ21510.1 tRNA 4-thiouridine(8) synthase ThiI [Streptomyces sp. 891-h]